MRRSYVIIALFVFGLFSSDVNAMILEPTGVSSVKREEQFDIYVSLNKTENEKNISAVEGILTYEQDVITLVDSYSVLNNWIELSRVRNNGIFSYANLPFDNIINVNNRNIIKLTFKVNADAIYKETLIGINDANAIDENGDSVKIESGSHVVKILSGVNTLSDLKIDIGNIKFKEDILNYNLVVENNISKITIDAKLTDDKSSFISQYGPRTVELKTGENKIEIKIKAENDDIKTYTLNIIREKEIILNDDNDIDNIEKNNNTGDFVIIIISILIIVSLSLIIYFRKRLVK